MATGRLSVTATPTKAGAIGCIGRWKLTEYQNIWSAGSAGELTQERTEPIAGDARKTKDGKLNAKLKLIAGLIGVDYDALKQRDQERRRRHLVALTTLPPLPLWR
jgi:hypothetical protein